MKCIYFFIGMTFLFTINLSLFASAMFEEHIIRENFDGGCAIAGGDFNNDSYVDFVATSYDGDYISWFENDGSQNFSEHSVITAYNGAKAVDTADIDGDGDIDFVATADLGNCVSWFENDGTGNFIRHDLITEWTRPSFVLVRNNFLGTNIDINNDGYTDIIVVSCRADKIGWLENDGSANFTLHIIKEDWDFVTSAVAYDFNNDSHMDIIATAKANGGETTLFLNNGNNTFSEQLIFTDWDAPNSIQVADINNDNLMDFAATSCGTSDAIGWFENSGNLSFIPHILKNQVNGSRAMTVWDIDQDEDVDLFSIGWQSADAFFFENKGNRLQERLLCDGTAYDLLKFYVTDLDNDNDFDLLASGYDDGQLRWFESLDEFLETDFYAEITTGHAPLTVNFQDDSQAKPDNNSWAWDFQHDGISDSYDANPQFVFNEPGIYSVALESSNGLLTDFCQKDDFIRVFNGESAIEYNGANGFCSCSATEENEISSSFTLESWIYPRDWGENNLFGGKIFDKGAVVVFLCENYNELNAHSLGVRLQTQTEDYTFACSEENSISLDQWQYICVSYDEMTNQIKIIINDQLQEVTCTLPPVGAIADNAQANIYIGNNATNQHSFNGFIDEIRLWNIVRTNEEIINSSQNYLIGNENGLIAYWKFNEGNGFSSEDNSINNFEISLENCIWVQGTSFEFTDIPDDDVIVPINDIDLRIYPNPLRVFSNSKDPNTSSIHFTLNEQSDIKISVFNLKGQKVDDIFMERMNKGEHTIRWALKRTREFYIVGYI